MDVTLDSIRDIQLFQSRNGYRFSVDSLLLYNFVNLKRANRIADLGAGAGIVGLLLAKKYPDAHITLFELQNNLVKLAEKNVVQNRLEDRVKTIRCDLRTLSAIPLERHTYDLVVSNPPFRRLRSGRLNREDEKAIARHEIKMKLHEVIDAASFFLKTKGRFCIIYHPCRLTQLIDNIINRGLEPKRLRFVHSNVSSEAKMILVEAIKGARKGMKVERPFYIYKESGTYTDEMKEIYA